MNAADMEVDQVSYLGPYFWVFWSHSWRNVVIWEWLHRYIYAWLTKLICIYLSENKEDTESVSDPMGEKRSNIYIAE